MNLLKDLAGGVLVILAAALIGIAQNAARDDSIPLVPKAANAVTANHTNDAATDDPTNSGGQPATASVVSEDSYSPVPTESELAQGVVSMARLENLLESKIIILIDARSHEDYDAGHIAGSISLPYDEILGHYDELSENFPTGADIVIYCESVTCDQSENLATELKLLGYERVVVYKGGWQEWEAAGLPTEKSGTETTGH